MIIDKLENISLYVQIPEDAANFIKKLDVDIPEGKYIISDSIYANVEEYYTKKLTEAKFESHKKYIDIQFLLVGNENIFYTNVNSLIEKLPYNPEKDITFYSDNLVKKAHITLDGTNFVMLYPHEAHAPQVRKDKNSEKVKKVVIKIKI